MEKFDLGEIIKQRKKNEELFSSCTLHERTAEFSSEKDLKKWADADEYRDFYILCNYINQEFMNEWEHEGSGNEQALKIQKNAIIGYAKEVSYFKNKIADIISRRGDADLPCPPWYESLVDGVYHENWGVAGMAEWFASQYMESSSAKIIGDRIYFLEDGVMKLMRQRISKERRNQLIRALLMLTPNERLDKDFHEVYMLDGTRITIFKGDMVKENQDVIIFRRYIIPRYSFEEQARRNTIPAEAIALFKSMVKLGYNVAFTGAVRTAKTSFLSTWQSHEDPSLEGVMVETDPEIPLHKMMPNAPIVQIIADNDKLKSVTKNLLRSDSDYVIMAEAREGVALDTAIKIASKGTRRMKITFHSRNPMDFPYDVAEEITKSMGGDIEHVARRVASSFDYIFHFIQLADKSKKRLRGIYEISYNRNSNKIEIQRICKYDYKGDSWLWKHHIGRDKYEAGIEENAEEFRQFSRILKNLELSSGQGIIDKRKFKEGVEYDGQNRRHDMRMRDADRCDYGVQKGVAPSESNSKNKKRYKSAKARE